MKVKVISVFRDKFTGKYYTPGEVIEVSEESRVLDMESRVVVARHVVRTGRTIDPAPMPLAPSRFAEAKLGSLVRVAGLRMEPVCDTTWAVPARLSADGTPRTALLKFFTDGGDSLYVSTPRSPAIPFRAGGWN